MTRQMLLLDIIPLDLASPVLARLPTRFRQQAAHIRDDAALQCDAHGIHEFVEETHHGNPERQPLEVAFTDKPQDLFAILRTKACRDLRKAQFPKSMRR